ncbi:CAP domain-containing protein [uncultured Campylobacter sp.]|uniref:CAP domain-containing protein n=1 Tax=uncultured Campylobacter sp. TaxID=218934 RepID=UPI00261D5C69|nr:CAP domain-containing protein [uncultured Campylobacter sp.]
MKIYSVKRGLKFSLLACALFLAGCDIFGGQGKDSALKSAKQPEFSFVPDSDAVAYLNEYRRGSGLSGLKPNQILSQAAKNHAEYSAQNEYMGHDEAAGRAKFSGATPADRALAVGYKSTLVLENIAYKSDFKEAVDGLFSAIYHRFAFLNLSVDEVGYALASKDKFNAFVFEMGNSRLNGFCAKGASDTGAERFYTNVCADKNLKIKDAKFDNFTGSSKPFVKFPDATAVTPYFSGEIPDPFPECKITANPVSVEFNANAGEVKFKDFEIFKDGRKLQNLHVITSANDINSKFSSKQFAAFSREVFDFGAQYEAVFSYEQANAQSTGAQVKQIKWSFKIKTPQNPYFDARDGDVLGVDADKTYEIFFRPKDCNDLMTRYSYKASGFMTPTVAQSGTNTLSIKLKGMAGDTLSIVAGDMSVKVRLKTSSPEAVRERRAFYVKAGLMIAGVIVIFALIGRKMRR